MFEALKQFVIPQISFILDHQDHEGLGYRECTFLYL
jgi:hypothetical protein